jgi:phage shock protein C
VNRLYRSRSDRMLAGVAGGIAEMVGIDPSLVRIGWVVLAFASGGLVVLLYILMAIIVPEGPEPLAAPPFGAPPSAMPASYGGAPAADAFTPSTETTWGQPHAPDTGPVPSPPRPRDERATALVLGGILVAAGALLLVQRFVPALEPGVVWPVALVALGVLLLLGSVRRR